ncbi:alanyl-tRNA editing protein [Serratia sp. NPDC078593]|uniref:alanyl-tRNA editing protein n=1 Tax=unclassified Serratia (in: enterobacteria) TaxID=2647522 RepID=UPI0037D6E48C
MTERRYYDNDDLQLSAEVVACTPFDDALYAVELNTTIFHPQGGGQPADKGSLNGVPVMRVLQQDNAIQHIVAEPLPLGAVNVVIDPAVRALHARWHSAGHMIGYLGERQGWQPVKAHHWPGEGRITFVAGAEAKTLDPSGLQTELMKLIAADLPRVQHLDNGLRKVGFGDLPAYGCGGTHVGSLAEVGQVQINAVKMKKGQLIVQYEVL